MGAEINKIAPPEGVLRKECTMSNETQPGPVEPTVRPLREKEARIMALLMDEAAANLAALMETPQADALGVRYFLPDELKGCAHMLREAYGLPEASA